MLNRIVKRVLMILRESNNKVCFAVLRNNRKTSFKVHGLTVSKNSIIQKQQQQMC